MRTFSIQTLGCKVNQYESDQIASVLRAHGLTQESPEKSDVQIINTCSVTLHAAKDSRRLTRKAVKLGRKTIVTGCWATSDKTVAEQLGADAVLTHHDNVAEELSQILDAWKLTSVPHPNHTSAEDEKIGLPGLTLHEKSRAIGTTSLPILAARQSSHQRAFVKIQDGCDAHCTYCIIPHLRPLVWSKPIEEVVREAQNLVNAGHGEIVLTGIFLGAYNQATALRRRQVESVKPIRELIEALCTRVPGLRRLRLSSLEPGDLNSDLIAVLKSYPQLVPHFHLPLQSGSDFILRRMNRQYTRDDFLRMIDEVNHAFDRPALTTDIIVGFPGETDDEFARTLEVVDAAKFIHIHAFSFSPRPGTAAARWAKDFVRGPIVNERIAILNDRARAFSENYRRQFIGETVEVLVEQFDDPTPPLQHGRCERYFDVHFEGSFNAGEAVKVRIDRVTSNRTFAKSAHRRLPVLASARMQGSPPCQPSF